MKWFKDLVPNFDSDSRYSIELKSKGKRKVWMTGHLYPVENGVHITSGKTLHIYKNRILSIEKYIEE